MSLAEQTLSLSSLVVILCRKAHQEQLEESEMVPRYLPWVLDHLVAVSRVSRIVKQRDRGFRKDKSTDSVPLPWGLHIQDQFAVVEDLKLF